MCSTPAQVATAAHVSQSFTAHKEKTTSDGADLSRVDFLTPAQRPLGPPVAPPSPSSWMNPHM